jgi:hypothetical protein
MVNIRKKQMMVRMSNWKALAGGIINKMETRKSIIVKSIIMENCLKKSKKIIASDIKEKVERNVHEKSEAILKNWETMVKFESKRCFSMVELCVTTKRIWSVSIKNIGDGIFKYIRDKLEKERIEAQKRRIKRLRQKCRTLIKKRSMENIVKSIKQTKIILKCSELWGIFEEQLRGCGKIMLGKLYNIRDSTTKKREKLNEMLVLNASRSKEWVQKAAEKYNRR